MLGLTSYQEALRALGRVAESPTFVTIFEHAEQGYLEFTTPAESRQIHADELEDIVAESLAQRGDHRVAGELSDLLRAMGQALDQLHALDVCLDLSPQQLRVQFSDQRGGSHELTYAGEELKALRAAAAARRNGQPLRRVLILQAGPDSAASILELLVAEFAVQALPTRYARAVALSAEPPDLVLAQVSPGLVEALRAMRTGHRTSDLPVLVLASPECDIGADELFASGATDVLQEPVQPAQLRARLRTWLLRGRAGTY
jgi:CheY-like chemotaxis protein